MPAPTAAAAAPGVSTAQIVAVLGALLAVIGPLLPWISVGALRRSGVELGSDGKLILAGALVAGVLALFRPFAGWRATLCLLVGIGVVIVGIADASDVRERIAQLDRTILAGAGSVGPGLYATIIGGAGIGLASAVALFRS